MMKSIATILICLIGLVFGCAGRTDNIGSAAVPVPEAPDSLQVPEGWQAVNDHGVSYFVPNDWIKNSEGYDSPDHYAAMGVLLNEDVVTLDNFTTRLLLNMKLKGVNILEVHDGIIDGNPSTFIMFSSDKIFGMSMTIGKKVGTTTDAYTLVCGMEVKAIYENQSTCQKIVLSFRVK